jgi:hypothetical protein
MPGKKKPQPRAQFFSALRDDKGTRALDTIRWCLRHGGVNIRAEDDNGLTAIHIAAVGNKLEILQALCDHVKQAGAPDDLDVGDPEGRSALMLAAHKGNLEACKILSKAGSSWALKCDEDLTARDYAAKRGTPALLSMFDGGLPALLQEKAVVATAGDEAADAAAEEAKAKKWRVSQLDANKQAERDVAVHEARLKEREHVEATLETAPKAQWAEVQAVIDSKGRELSITRNECAQVDPALWSCITLNSLRLRVEAGTLHSLPPSLSLLSGLTSLIVSHTGLTALPPQLGTLSKLRVLEAVGNQLSALPAEVGECLALEVLALGHNRLEAAAVIERLPNLNSLNLDRNRLTQLPIPGGEHLRTLSAAENQITSIPPSVGGLQQLRELTLTANCLEELPAELGELQPKVPRGAARRPHCAHASARGAGASAGEPCAARVRERRPCSPSHPPAAHHASPSSPPPLPPPRISWRPPSGPAGRGPRRQPSARPARAPLHRGGAAVAGEGPARPPQEARRERGRGGRRQEGKGEEGQGQGGQARVGGRGGRCGRWRPLCASRADQRRRRL